MLNSRQPIADITASFLSQATSSKLEHFVEDVDPPYVQLVFQEPKSFVDELQRDRLASVFSAVQAAHPNCTLGLIVVGLKPYVQKLDNQQMRQVR